MTTPLQSAVHTPAAPAASAAATLPKAGPSAASTYTDVNGLAALKKDSTSPQAIRAVAQQVDALFLQMMLQSMREASADIGGQESNEMGMYQDMFDKQIALTLSQHQGLGLGSLLARQLSRAATPAATPGAAQATAPAAPTPAPSAPAAGLVQHAADFVSEVMPTIRVAAEALGVSPLGMLAQAALETGWGQRMARTADGAPSLNLFGIKAGGGWSGAQASAATVEYTDGVATQSRTAFRAYGSVEESINDFAGLLANSPRYREAIAAGGSAQGYVQGIGRSGYASDPDYANKLNEVLNGPTFRTAVRLGLAKL